MDRMTGSARSVVLRPSERIGALFDLQARLAATIARVDRLRGQPYRFSPHLTLVYRKGEAFDWEVEPISWQADELLLVHSKVGLTQHIVCGRWPLAAPVSVQGRQRPVDRFLPMAFEKGVRLGEMPASEKTRMCG
jgi:2'-5' RNA ligase